MISDPLAEVIVFDKKLIGLLDSSALRICIEDESTTERWKTF